MTEQKRKYVHSQRVVLTGDDKGVTKAVLRQYATIEFEDGTFRNEWEDVRELPISPDGIVTLSTESPRHAAKRHTEADMRKALARYDAIRQYLNLLRDDDDPTQILSDCIDEVLAARQVLIEMQQYMSGWLAKMTRR